MPALEALIGGALGVILQPLNFAILVGATILGLIMGMIPGMNGAILLALLIPLTFDMAALPAFMFLVAANGGTSQGGAITSILLNTPGTAPNAATLIDGHPMAEDGRAAEAIGASSVASGLGALIGLSILAFSIPIMLQIVLLFGPAEVFWLGIWGMSAVALVVSDNFRAGIISAGLGLLFSMIGINQMTGGTRWTFNIPMLLNGVHLVPTIIGLFAIAEMIKLVAEGTTIAETADVEIGTGVIDGAKSVITHKYVFLRGTIIGLVIGAIPGVGGTAANYIAYFQTVQTSNNSEQFGTGDIRGVIASEAANDAKEGGAYIPTLGLGIPGSASMAVLFGAFLLHGIQPGPLMLERHLNIVVIVIVSALVSNVVSSVAAFSGGRYLAKITDVNIGYIVPPIIATAILGAYAINNQLYDVGLALLFGILGYIMVRVGMSRIPVVLGLVLGPIIQLNFFQTMQIYDGTVTAFFSTTLSLILVALTVLTLILPYVQKRFSIGVLTDGF